MATPHPSGLLPKDIVKPDDHTTWELAWTQGITPWDAGEVQPSLIEAIEKSGLELPPNGRALVPGCGTGYDIVYLASKLGYEAIGADIAATAIKRANELIDNFKKKTNDANLKASIIQTDFFKWEPSEAEKFDLVYDHTFFCAIPPALRNDWGKKMAQLLKPGGYLVTSVYPMLPYVETGPPYYLRPEHYIEPLSEHFNWVLDKVPEKSSLSHEGKERLVIWRRK
ncbi:hypothetical protein CVT24_006927 [Panaeolus cyanescens]|uniref:Methyltransferase domain-containing protein n=1 Tax=Panaeolus cyanescens TaxID=181874 RepID=A0A409VK53_9AGAR|nr:hypothetical protein CVT24_006927 [Panaeolus cyanescens]